MVKAEGAFAVDRRGFHVHVQAECASVKMRSPDVDQIANGLFDRANRSEERSVGKECVSKCRYRRSQYHEKKKKKETHSAIVLTTSEKFKNHQVREGSL